MKTSFNKLLSTALLLSFSTAFIACSTAADKDNDMSSSAVKSAEFAEGKPGGIYTQTVTLVAKISKIDYEKRTVTIVDDQGISRHMKVGPEATNFSKAKKGDRVTIQMIDELAVYVRDKNAPTQDDSGAMLVAKADEKAAKPAGLIADTVELNAVVKAIDVEKHTATLQFQDKSVKTVNVRPDVVLNKNQVGSQVVIRMTTATAIAVDPAK